jgi:hypothetical protein
MANNQTEPRLLNLGMDHHKKNNKKYHDIPVKSDQPQGLFICNPKNEKQFSV